MIVKRLLASVFTLALLAGTAAAEVEWTDMSYTDIVAKAKADGKYVYIDFFTTWCGPCKQMDKVTYTDEKVNAFLGDMITVKWDAEKGDGIELAKKYRIHHYPTSILLGPDGEEIDRYIGYLDPPEFLETFSNYQKGVGTVATYVEALEKSPDDVDVLCMAGIKLAQAVRTEEASACLERAFALDPDNKSGLHPEMHYWLGEAYYADEDYAGAKKEYDVLATSFADSDYGSDGMKRLAYVEHKLGNDDDAVAMYDKLIADDLDDPRALNGFAWFCSQRGIGLDKALAYALKAVELSDRDAGILDTLAEVYYARGEFDEAIAAAEEALASDPDDQYFNDQVKKFKDAKAQAEKQARR